MSEKNPKSNQTDSRPAIDAEGLSKQTAQPLRKPIAGTTLVAIGFAWGAGILLFDYLPLTDPVLKTPPFQLYFLGVISQTVVFAISFGLMWPALRSLKSQTKGYKGEVLLWTILFITLVYSSKYFAVSCPVYNVKNHDLKTNLLTYSGGTVAVLAGIGSILANIGLRNLLQNKNSSEDLTKPEADAQLVSRYLELRRYLLLFLSVLGVILGLVAVTQSAKRYLIRSSGLNSFAQGQCTLAKLDALTGTCIQQVTQFGYYCVTPFELKKVFVYGLYYTLILVLTFLPTFTTLIATGHNLRDNILPLPSPNSDSWSSTCAKRAKLDKLLALSVTESLRAIIAVLAPILGSLISLIGLLKP